MDTVVPMLVGGLDPNIGPNVVKRSSLPVPVDLIKEWEPWSRCIFDAMILMNVQDFGDTIFDAIGHCLVTVFKAHGPAMVAPSYVMSPDNPRLNPIENFRRQQAALVVIRVVGSAVATR